MTICLLCAALPALAASSAEAWLIPFAAAYQPPVGDFNAGLAGQLPDAPQARSRHFGWGLELRTLTGSWLVGPLFFKTWDNVSHDSFRLRTDATGIFGEVGLKVAPFSFLTIVPQLAVGGLSQTFALRENTKVVDFGTLFGDSPAEVSLGSGTKLAGMAALELGVAANSSAGRIGVALRGGYLYSPLATTWHLANGAAVNGAPDSRLGGWFFSAGLLLMPQAQTSGQND
jgi:hypothetical protein